MKVEGHHQQIVVTSNVCSWKTKCSGTVHTTSEALACSILAFGALWSLWYTVLSYANHIFQLVHDIPVKENLVGKKKISHIHRNGVLPRSCMFREQFSLQRENGHLSSWLRFLLRTDTALYCPVTKKKKKKGVQFSLWCVLVFVTCSSVVC